MSKKIAFIRPKPIPIANVRVLETLASHFNDYEIDVIDIKSLVKSRLDILAINTLFVILLYGRDIVFGYKEFKDSFWRTPYIFQTVKRLLARRLGGKNYDFTFQMQSLFDCSLPGVPHFIYTDHTHLANLTYSNFDKRRLYHPRWINLEKRIYQNATMIFLWSSHIKQSLIEKYGYPEEQAVLVYVGSNVDMTGSRTSGKTYEKQNILFVGLDWERKGGPD